MVREYLKYIIGILKALMWPIIFGLIQFSVIIIFTLIFNNSLNITGSLTEYIQTSEYQTLLAQYLSDYKLLIMAIMFAISMPIILKLYKKSSNKYNKKIDIKTVIYLIIVGISIALIYNIFINELNKIVNITNLYSESLINTNLLIQLLTVGVMGPIIEEYIFRGIVYNRLKILLKKNVAIIITSLIFALVHADLAQMMYAFILSVALIHVYDKYQTIKAPILVHISANTIIILTIDLIINGHHLLNYLIMSCFIIILVHLFRKSNNK